MKFSKVLQRLASELPELDKMFLRYKSLKKQLKSIPVQEHVAQQMEVNELPKGCMSSEEEHFIQTLNQDLEKFNRFFIEREEEAVIQLQVLSERLGRTRSPEVLANLVDFHGQCVLLLHWSLLNYAAVAKILKKHDKRTGVLLRVPYLANCLQQPFNSTTIMSRLVRSAEELLSGALGPKTRDDDATARAHEASRAQEAIRQSEDDGSCLTAVSDSALFRRTRLALETWDTLGRTAATPSTVLMEPPAGTAVNPTPDAAGAVRSNGHVPVLVVAGRPMPRHGPLLIPMHAAKAASPAAAGSESPHCAHASTSSCAAGCDADDAAQVPQPFHRESGTETSVLHVSYGTPGRDGELCHRQDSKDAPSFDWDLNRTEPRESFRRDSKRSYVSSLSADEANAEAEEDGMERSQRPRLESSDVGGADETAWTRL